MQNTQPAPSGVTELEILLFVSVIFLCIALFIAISGWIKQDKGLTRELWTYYRLEFLIVGAVLIPAYLGGWSLLLVVLLFALRALWELLSIQGIQAKSHQLLTLAVLLLALELWGTDQLMVMLFVLLALLQLLSIAKPDSSDEHGRVLAATLLLAIPLAHMLLLQQESNGFLWLFLVYLVVEINDASALLIGKLVGKHHPLPLLSPKKTSEGILGGIVVASLIGIVFSTHYLDLSWLEAAGAVLIITFSGIVGDLFISALKRQRRVKDFPPLHTAVGGALDIYDALIFAVPSCYYYLVIIGRIA